MNGRRTHKDEDADFTRRLQTVLTTPSDAGGAEADTWRTALDGWPAEEAPTRLYWALIVGVPTVSSLELLLFWMRRHVWRPVMAFGLPLFIGVALSQWSLLQQPQSLEALWLEHARGDFVFFYTTPETG